MTTKHNDHNYLQYERAYYDALGVLLVASGIYLSGSSNVYVACQ
jgi:hypothetical protein